MNRKRKTFMIDGDALEITYTYDEQCRVWIGDYPYFEEEIRITPGGRRWRNVAHDNCPYADGSHGDCGTCPHLRRQSRSDLIGVCFHDALRASL